MARAERFALEPAAAHQLELDQLAALDLRLEGFAVVAAVNLEDDGAAEVLRAPLRHKDFSALYEELNGGGSALGAYNVIQGNPTALAVAVLRTSGESGSGHSSFTYSGQQ